MIKMCTDMNLTRSHVLFLFFFLGGGLVQANFMSNKCLPQYFVSNMCFWGLVQANKIVQEWH